MSTFNAACVNDALQGTIFHGKLQHFTTIDSTNSRALADAQAGAEAGQVYIADEQTAGRGRGGHTWHSEAGSGLYLSVLFRPVVQADAALQISLAAALAAQSAVMHSCSYAMDIRWPNDLVTPPGSTPARKLGGILIETASGADGTLRHAVIGIGINLNQQTFPGDLVQFASSVRIESGSSVSRENVLIQVLHELEAEMSALEAEVLGARKQPFLNGRFLLSSTWVRGKQVRVEGDESYTGTTEGLTQAGMLRVRCDDGKLRLVRNGGVRER